MATSTTQAVPEIEPPHWVSRLAFPILTVALILVQIALGFAVYHGWFWTSVVLMLIVSHLMHGQVIGFHEASHGLLRKNRRLNDFDGLLIGILSFTSFTLYRASHQTHHMHLASERDEELWPFVMPEVPRWKRVLAAFLELFVGILYTPFLFYRTFLREGSPIRAPKVRQRIWREIYLMIAVWIIVLAAVAWLHVWTYFLWLFLVPAIIAGNLQSWRKFIEHVGMTGHTPNSATRSIVCRTWLGHLVAFTLLHEPYHGVHHEYAGVPHADLPGYAASLEPKEPEDVPPFPNYRAAFWHLLRCLADPRVGAQWRAIP